MPDRFSRRMKNRIDDVVDSEFKKLMHEASDRMNKMLMMDDGVAKEEITPDRAGSTMLVVAPPEPKDLDMEMESEETDDVVDPPAPTDEFMKRLQEEIVLQSRIEEDDKQHAIKLEHKNGKPMKVVVTPNSQTAATFSAEANKSGWVESMLDANVKKEGMLACLAKKSPKTFKKVAKKKRIFKKHQFDLSTAQTLALARVGNLNDVRLKNVKSFLKNVADVRLECKTKDIAEINEEVELKTANEEVTFGSIIHEWATSKRAKAKDKKKAPEKVECWNSNLAHEVEATVDSHVALLFGDDENLKEMPVISYVGDGFEQPGVAVLIGGDHGDKNCPVSVKLNLSSPQERKRLNKLNYRCPIVPFSNVQCTKDSCDLLEKTIIPKARECAKQLQGGTVITVCHNKNVRGCHKLFLIPRNTNPGPHGLCGIDVSVDDTFKDIPFFELSAKVVVSQFNDLYVGDLAFLAMLIGMNRKHCVLCQLGFSGFNCNKDEHVLRTKDNLAECLEEWTRLYNPITKKPPNCKGVNAEGLLLNVDPQRIITPMLHCPMGLIDKALETFVDWVNLEVERCDYEVLHAARSVYKIAINDLKNAEETYNVAKAELSSAPNNPQLKEAEKKADNKRKQASNVKTKAKATHDRSLTIHNVKRSSFKQQFEEVCRSNGVKREYCHGGKFNGVNCIRIMGNAEVTFFGSGDKEGFYHKCISSKASTVTEEVIRTKIQDYVKLLTILDSIWSKARGIESGSLPTEQQHNDLDAAVDKGKQQWLKCGITANQPKWHLTFDGHLSEQVKRFQGLADKANDSMEKFHQDLKVLRNGCRSIRSHKTRENCIRRELRRKTSPSTQQHIHAYEEKKKQSTSTKRKQEATKRQDAAKQAKKEKRDAAVSS